MQKKKTIGVLGGMGPESTALFYQSLISNYQRTYGAQHDSDYPEIFIYNLPIPNIVEELHHGSAPHTEVNQMLIKGAQKMESIGVNFIVMPCNTAHYFYDDMAQAITVPFLNIFSVTAKKIQVAGFKKVGLLATSMTTNSGKLHAIFNDHEVEVINPNEADQKMLTSIILNILAGEKNDSDRTEIKKIISTLQNHGAEAIVLACTELPLLVQQSDVGTNLFDTVEILAEVTARYSMNDDSLETLQ